MPEIDWRMIGVFVGLAVVVLSSTATLVGLIWNMQGKRVDRLEDAAREDRDASNITAQKDRDAFKATAQRIFDKVDEHGNKLAEFMLDAQKQFVTKNDCKNHRDSGEA